jgi:hypothetical protein
MSQSTLHAVAASDEALTIDTWLAPVSLPEGTSIIPFRSPAPREWTFVPQSIMLVPMPAKRIEDTIKDYVGYAVLTHHHRKWLLEHQRDMLEEWTKFDLYFPSDVYLYYDFPNKAVRQFVYRIKYGEDKTWSEEQALIESIPPAGSGRIMMTIT